MLVAVLHSLAHHNTHLTAFSSFLLFPFSLPFFSSFLSLPFFLLFFSSLFLFPLRPFSSFFLPFPSPFPLLLSVSSLRSYHRRQVALGANHMALLTAQGMVLTSGSNQFGQLGRAEAGGPGGAAGRSGLDSHGPGTVEVRCGLPEIGHVFMSATRLKQNAERYVKRQPTHLRTAIMVFPPAPCFALSTSMVPLSLPHSPLCRHRR